MKQLKVLKIKGQEIGNELDISSFEDANKLKLPDSYKNFVLAYQGGYCEYDFLETTMGEEFSIKLFLPIKGVFSFIGMFENIKEMFPKSSWFPFAIDEGDWVYCISLNSETRGKIFLMRTDEELENEAFKFVCESFDSFIDGLYLED